MISQTIDKEVIKKDGEDWEKSQFWYQNNIHDPEPMPIFDLIFSKAWQKSQSQYTARPALAPPGRDRTLLNGDRKIGI